MGREELWKTASSGDASLAYIYKDTKANPEFTELANAALVTAKAIMEDLKSNDKLSESFNPEGEKRPDKMVIKARKGNDGKTFVQGEIKHGVDTLTVNFSNKIEDGALKATSMSASKFIKNQDGTSKSSRFKSEEIADANINDGLKAIAQHLTESGLIQPRTEYTRDAVRDDLFNVSRAANEYFSTHTDKVPSTKDESALVHNVYAKLKDAPARCVEIRSHTERDITVELGYNKEGEPFAAALNFELNKDGEVRGDKEPPMRIFINSKDQLELLPLQEIQDVVAGFKGFDQEMAKTLQELKDKPKPKDRGEER